MAECRTILVLGAGHQQLPVIEAAHRRGLRVVAIDPDPDAPGGRQADEFVVADLADTEVALDVARRVGVAGVLTFAADYPVPLVAAIAAELGLPGPAPNVARCLTDKLAMRRQLAAAGVPVPAFTVPGSAEIDQLGDPVVVKPTRASGSRGVQLVSRHDVVAAAAEAAAASADGGVVVEAYVEGPEVSVEALTVDGVTTVLAITDKVTTGPPDFVEVAHSQPTDLPVVEADAVAAVATAAVEALGLRWGPSHTELMLGADGPVVTEVAGRFGGGGISAGLLPITTGVDAAATAVAMSIGEEPAWPPARSKAGAVRFLQPEPGVVAEIRGVDAALEIPGARHVSVEVEVGDVVRPFRSARDRVGHVVVEADDPTAARRLAASVAASIDVITRPPC